jgi:CSLREA domain-containing protein
MKPSRFPSSIEALEPRIAPATITVTSLADDGGGALLTLREAIALADATPATADLIVFGGAAAAGGTIELATALDITTSLTIRGPGAGKLILDGNDATRIFNITDGAATVRSVVISGLSLVDGHAVGSGGGGILTAESLTLSNVAISSCVADFDGGGVFAGTTGRVVIKSSLIQGNSAAGIGGGLALSADGGVQITGSTISGNGAQSLGGGVFARIGSTGSGDILIDGTKLIGNASAQDGGGAWLENARVAGGVDVGKMTVRASFISGNGTAGDRAGGGLALNDGFARIERSHIANNSAGEGGGIFAADSDLLSVNASALTGNRALASNQQGGGGLQADGVTRTVIQSSVLAGNTSALNGGGFAIDAGTALVRSSTVSGNVADGVGGGGAATGTVVLMVESSRFLDNRAALEGGGLREVSSGKLTVKSSLFQGNQAAQGGGLRAFGDTAILGSRFIGNLAQFGGGAALDNATGESVVITGGLVSQNAALDSGGGLRLTGSGAKSILGTVIRDNVVYGTGGGTGGGIALGEGTLTFSKTTSVMYNAAAIRGGGIANNTVTPVALNGAKVVFNTAATDAQIFGPFTP